jgi:hypothetical protein
VTYGRASHCMTRSPIVTALPTPTVTSAASSSHPCLALYRMTIDYHADKNIVIRLATATIEMPGYRTATDLQKLLDHPATGSITPLLPKSGKYRYVPFAHVPSSTTLHDTTVIISQAQVVAGIPRITVPTVSLVLFCLGCRRSFGSAPSTPDT